MTNAQKAIVYSFNKKKEEENIKSLSPEERKKYYEKQAREQAFRYSLFVNGSNRESYKQF